MSDSQKPPRLVVTWAVLVPLLLVIAFVFSPGPILAMFLAAAISPVVHRAVRLFYADRSPGKIGWSKRVFGGG